MTHFQESPRAREFQHPIHTRLSLAIVIYYYRMLKERNEGRPIHQSKCSSHFLWQQVLAFSITPWHNSLQLQKGSPPLNQSTIAKSQYPTKKYVHLPEQWVLSIADVHYSLEYVKRTFYQPHCPFNHHFSSAAATRIFHLISVICLLIYDYRTPGVKSYSGYVHLPPGTLADVNETQDYPINTFFWFFESRTDPANAPLSIWMNGGPGSSSMIGLLQENGPCMINDDSNSTYLNPWSFNNEVNMLYIDQPNQVGFSWDVLLNVTEDLTSDEPGYEESNFGHTIPTPNNSFTVGTIPSNDPKSSANNTQNAARALWHFAQTWFQEFPAYKPNNSAISIFTESYGGRYGPAFAAFFEEQNQRITNHSIKLDGETYIIHLDTLGIINGCIDLLTQELAYPTMAFNNTYGIQTIDDDLYHRAVDAYSKPDGCRDSIMTCQSLAAQSDPNSTGSNKTVNEACSDADQTCRSTVEGVYTTYSGRNYYDIAAIDISPFPPNYYIGYLANAHVQSALGVPINYTQSTNGVFDGFSSTGDYARADIFGGYLSDIGYILDKGIKVALIYGDRDYACNWIGGEEVSLAVKYSQSAAFRKAGYANITTNSSYVGGQVRQHNNFSFSRVFQAGHEVPAYQPETAYRIFSRAIFGKDIATGAVDTSNNTEYSTLGSSTTFEVKNQDLGSPSPQCYIWAMTDTCTADQIESVRNGSALVHDYILIDANQSHLFPGVGNNDSIPGSNSTGAVGGKPSPKNEVVRIHVGLVMGVTALLMLGASGGIW